MAGSPSRERGLLDLIGYMYDASTDVDKWPIFLENVAGFFGGTGAQIGHYDTARNHHNFNFIHGFDFDRETLESIESFIPDDPRFQYGLAQAPRPIHCRMAVTTEQLHKTEIYKRLLAPVGIEYSAAVMLPLEDGLMTFLAIFRDEAGGVFGDEDCDWLGELVPHLNRTVSIFKKLSDSHLHDRIAPGLFDNVPIGIVIVDLEATIHFVNAAARSLADKSTGVRLDGERIELNSRAHNAELRRAIEACITKTGEQSARTTGEVMVVDSEHRRLAIRVNPLANHRKQTGYASVVDRDLAIVFITDPAVPQEAPSELLMRLFGLSQAEARLLECLVAGKSVKQAAGACGITGDTARSYLKSIFQKTDTHRQTDLMRLVLSTPVWIQATDPNATPI